MGRAQRAHPRHSDQSHAGRSSGALSHAALRAACSALQLGTLRRQPHGSRPVSTSAPSLPPSLLPHPALACSCLHLLALACPTSKLNIGRHKIGGISSFHTLRLSLRLKFAPPKAIRRASCAEHSRHAPNQGCLTCGLPSVEMNLISFCLSRASCGNIAEPLILD